MVKQYKKASIFESVKGSLQQKGFTPEDANKPTYSGKITIPSAGPGISVTCPDNPIIGGKYNVFFQIRAGNSPTKAGINTIIVQAEAGGMASSENTKAFGNTDWVKKQLGIIQNTLSQKFGSVSLGKLGFGSFSGGYDAVGKIISDPSISDKVNSVVVLDGIHQGKRGKPDPNGMKPWVQFAEKAKKDPSKKFVFVYTAVDPSSYASTSDSANYINKNVGAEQVPTENVRTFGGVKPTGVSSSGGYTAIQLFPRKDETKPGYGYNEREQRMQHIQAAKALPDVWNEYLKDWNGE